MGGTLNSPLVRLVEGEALDTQGVLPLNWNGTELNRADTCMVLMATANDRRTSRSSTCLRLWQLLFLLFGKYTTITIE
ncbi:hypothetical protein TNCV_3627061 [Trichonephila clavipes]|nr:hypothetical protein TNCV_3627061 [Trichonephila clavipes]